MFKTRIETSSETLEGSRFSQLNQFVDAEKRCTKFVISTMRVPSSTTAPSTFFLPHEGGDLRPLAAPRLLTIPPVSLVGAAQPSTAAHHPHGTNEGGRGTNQSASSKKILVARA